MLHARTPTRSLALLMLGAMLLLPADALRAEDKAERPLHPRAIISAADSFYRNVVCTNCKGDGKISKNKGKITPGDLYDQRTVDKVDDPCPKCKGSGAEKLRNRVDATATKFVNTLAKVDLEHEQSDSRLDAAREKLERMQCILEAQGEHHFNDWSLRNLNQTEFPVGDVVLINGEYDVHAQSGNKEPNRWVDFLGSNFVFLFKDIRIHNARDEQQVFAGGIITEVLPKSNGRRVVVVRDGFVVRADPDCPQG